MISVTMITDVRLGEPDLIAGLEMEPLFYVDGLDGGIVGWVRAPEGGWTHELLCEKSEIECAADVVDAYLGRPEKGNWIGSTEV